MKFNAIKKIRELVEAKIQSLSDLERKKIVAYIYISLTLFTASFFGFFAIMPTLNTISNLNKQYEDNKLVYEGLNKKLTNLQLLDFQYSEIQPDLESIYSAIPRTPQIPTLTRQLENVALNNNVVLTKISVGDVEIYPNKKKGPIYSFTFSISVYGDEDSINEFVSKIINFDRIIGIDRIITGIDEEKRYTATITGRAYFSSQ